jgi:hypothetical protein
LIESMRSSTEEPVVLLVPLRVAMVFFLLVGSWSTLRAHACGTTLNCNPAHVPLRSPRALVTIYRKSHERLTMTQHSRAAPCAHATIGAAFS